MSDSLRPHLGSSVHGIFPGKNTSGVPFPSPEDLSDPRIKPVSPELQVVSYIVGRFFTTEPSGIPFFGDNNKNKYDDGLLWTELFLFKICTLKP